jgi:alpha-tubulin suppressor-like RCC1 family protein
MNKIIMPGMFWAPKPLVVNPFLFSWGVGNPSIGNTGGSSDVPTLVYSSGVLSGKKITHISAGADHVLALDSSGAVFSWGSNTYGALANNSYSDSFFPVRVNTSGVLAGKIIIQIAAGGQFSLTLDSDGKVHAAGRGDLGELGNGAGLSSNVMVNVNTEGVLLGKTVNYIAAGTDHALAVTTEGKIIAWGYGTSGQLGNGTYDTTSALDPIAVDTTTALSGKFIIRVAGGFIHSLALDTDGKMYSWGGNDGSSTFGQLGTGDTNPSNVPVSVLDTGVLSGKIITKIAAGDYHSLALDSFGKSYSWGQNTFGELGDNSNLQRNSPVSVYDGGVLSGKIVTDISGGYGHTVAIANNNPVSFGLCDFGQLGDNTLVNSNVPVSVYTAGVLKGHALSEIRGGANYSVAI